MGLKRILLLEARHDGTLCQCEYFLQLQKTMRRAEVE